MKPAEIKREVTSRILVKWIYHQVWCYFCEVANVTTAAPIPAPPLPPPTVLAYVASQNPTDEETGNLPPPPFPSSLHPLPCARLAAADWLGVESGEVVVVGG